MSYKVTRWISFILSAWLVLVLGRSVEPSLSEGHFEPNVILPWYGPAEFLYIALNVGAVMLLVALVAMSYQVVRDHWAKFPCAVFWTFIAAFLYGAVIYPSAYLFTEARLDRLVDRFIQDYAVRFNSTFAVMESLVFGVMVALLGFLVQYLFYTLPNIPEPNNASVSEKAKTAAKDREETPGLKRSVIVES